MTKTRTTITMTREPKLAIILKTKEISLISAKNRIHSIQMKRLAAALTTTTTMTKNVMTTVTTSNRNRPASQTRLTPRNSTNPSNKSCTTQTRTALKTCLKMALNLSHSNQRQKQSKVKSSSAWTSWNASLKRSYRQIISKKSDLYSTCSTLTRTKRASWTRELPSA